MSFRIAIDCMGGDHGPKVTVPAALAFVNSTADAELMLVGREPAIRAELDRLGASQHSRLRIVNAEEFV